jgi:hypothetical protein
VWGVNQIGREINAQEGGSRSRAAGEFQVAEEFKAFAAYEGFGGASEGEVMEVEGTPVSGAFETTEAGTGRAT